MKARPVRSYFLIVLVGMLARSSCAWSAENPQATLNAQFLKDVQEYLESKYYTVKKLSKQRIIQAEQLRDHLNTQSLESYCAHPDDPLFIDFSKKKLPDGSYAVHYFPVINMFFEQQYEGALNGLNHYTGKLFYASKKGIFQSFTPDYWAEYGPVLKNVSRFFHDNYICPIKTNKTTCCGAIIDEDNRMRCAFDKTIALVKIQSIQDLCAVLDLRKKYKRCSQQRMYQPKKRKQ